MTKSSADPPSTLCTYQLASFILRYRLPVDHAHIPRADITTPGSNSPLHKRRNYEIIDQVQTQNAKIFNPRAIYDGRKIMFSSASIPSTPVRML